MSGIIKFIDYENLYGRKVEIISDIEEIKEKINYALLKKNEFINIEKPSCRSAFLTIALIDGCDIYNFFAAFVKLPCLWISYI